MDPRCGLVVDWELTETADLQQAWQSPVQPWREGNQRGGGLLVLLVLRLTTVAGVTLLLQQGHACNMKIKVRAKFQLFLVCWRMAIVLLRPEKKRRMKEVKRGLRTEVH